jgi:EpsI family protein
MTRRILVLTIALLAASAYIARASKPEVVPVREHLSGIPIQLGAWQGRQEPDIDQRVLAVLGVDDYINRTYFRPDRAVAGLYVGYYQSQREGDTMHSPLNCLPGAGWNPAKREHISIPITGDEEQTAIVVNQIVILKGTDKQVVLYWYQSHGRVVASEYWGKIYTVIDALRTNRTDAALVRVICPVSGQDAGAEAEAEEQAVDFVRALYPLLGKFLPE